MKDEGNTVSRNEVLGFVQAFYAIARVDELVRPVFKRIVSEEEWPTHFESITNFLMAVAFNGPAFRGDPLTKHARIRDISEDHFKRWVKIFNEVAVQYWDVEIANHLIHRVSQIASSLSNGVNLLRRGGIITTKDLH
jgi:hemoglobin